MNLRVDLTGRRLIRCQLTDTTHSSRAERDERVLILILTDALLQPRQEKTSAHARPPAAVWKRALWTGPPAHASLSVIASGAAAALLRATRASSRLISQHSSSSHLFRLADPRHGPLTPDLYLRHDWQNHCLFMQFCAVLLS